VLPLFSAAWEAVNKGLAVPAGGAGVRDEAREGGERGSAVKTEKLGKISFKKKKIGNTAVSPVPWPAESGEVAVD
jgi:hypothetical protein